MCGIIEWPLDEVYMFCAIWEFAQSRDCVAHSRNPEIMQAISRLRKPRVRNLIACACTSDHPTVSDLLCVAHRIEDILDRWRLAPYYDLEERVMP